MADDPLPRVIVVGGGITGLTCAWYLRGRARVTVLEAGERVGGKIRTEEFCGVPLEAGPDLFLARVPWAVDLCRDAGLADDLVAPATGRAFVWSGGRLRPFPDGLVLGVPRRLGPMVRSGLVSPRGLARAALDLALPRRPSGTDPSVSEVVGARFGREVVDRVVEPLLGGIHAGRADGLSLESVAPEVAAAARSSRSLLLGLRRSRAGTGRGPGASPPAAGPVFLTVRGGLGRLVDRLADGADIRLSTAATEVGPTDDGVVVRPAGGSPMAADAVVITVAAGVAASMVRAACPAAADSLAAVRYASVATVTLAYPRGSIGHPLDGSGFVVPRVDGRLVTACTFLTSKWADLARSPHLLLRASVGRVDDERFTNLDDGALVAAVHGELAEAVGAAAAPLASRVSRWTGALPQYEPGHRSRIDGAQAALAESIPGAVLAGAAYGGLGIAACVRQGREAADALAEAVADAGEARSR